MLIARLFLCVFFAGVVLTPAEAINYFASPWTIELAKPRVALNGKDIQTVSLILEAIDPKSIESVEVSINTGIGDNAALDGYFKWDKAAGFEKIDGGNVKYADLVVDQCRCEIQGKTLSLIFSLAFKPLYRKVSDNNIVWRFSQYGKALNDWEDVGAKFATVADFRLLDPPSGLVAVHHGAGWYLSWDENLLEDSTTNYNVYRSFCKEGPYQRINKEPFKSAYFNDVKAAKVSKAYYKVTKLNTEGNESKLSEICQII
jgi:hypothetical protein